MGRNMDYPQRLMGQHHAIFFRVGVVRVDLRMAGIVMSGQVDIVLVQSVCDRGLDLPRHCQLNDLYDIAEGTLSAHLLALQICRPGLRLSQLLLQGPAVLFEVPLGKVKAGNLEHIDYPGSKHRVAYAANRMDCHSLGFRDHCNSALERRRVSHNQRAAFIVCLRLQQHLYRQLRTVPRRVPHGNSYNWLH